MKHLVDLTILCTAITFSVFLYRNNKMREMDQLDELKIALANLRNNLGCGSRIGCVVNTRDNSITNSQIQNAMVPAVIFLESPAFDSTLFVFDSGWSDSAISATIGSRREVWHSSSANFKLRFTANR